MDRIAIVEDEISCSNMLLNYVRQYNEENGKNVQAVVFHSAVDFLSDYDGSFFAVFMDIDLPMINGMDAARKLRLADQTVSIIFTTNLANYAINGYEVGALDFIVKPVTYFNFVSKMEKARNIRDLNKDLPVIIPLKDKKEIVKMSELYYVENDAHNVIYHTARGNFQMRRTMAEVEEDLKGGSFASCGKSYLVNLAYVETIEGRTATVHGDKIPISRAKEKEFGRALTIYIGGMKSGNV
ncbi:MAG: LytTR family DNA-binding domain-containing protein [Clostridia bacterium]|nr:LytTR family DNA-binding domain-containing protein [Clostridia bacterium]